jgi:fructan beta-fructosidase
MRTPSVLLCLLLTPALYAAPDIVFADFEGDTYGTWTATGTAFGKGPASGTLANQMPVSGFKGKRLVNSYHGGDGTTGTLTSPAFEVKRKYVHFLIGGGGHVDKTCMNLVVDGKVVRTATGPRDGSEQLDEASWDVSDLAGKSAKLVIVDDATGGWGHVLIDHIVFTDTRPAGAVSRTRDLVAKSRYLHFPIKNGAKVRNMTVSVAGKPEYRFTIELADGTPDWWAFLDVSAHAGKTLTLEVDRLPAGSKALESVRQSDSLEGAADLYREKYRPQLTFSSRRGWLNDPNGLVYYDGVYHLFYQHNPYGVGWGNMHWGHAVSKDLLRWEEKPIALYPDRLGPMFSGSAVVDWKNSSGLGEDGKPPLVLFYTAAGNPSVQCLAYSNDKGKSWTKYARNPIIKNIAPEDRDPKVIWHEPSKRWVMVLYVGLPRKGGVNHTIQFFTSTDLKAWKYASRVEGFFECPDLFELPLDGDPKRTKWVLTAASSEYVVGTFDGEKFTPETAKLPGQRGKGFYAAQTFSDIPRADGRRIQIGWGQTPTPGMPFSQMMCLPCTLSLKTTAHGPRLAWHPIKEIEALRVKSHAIPAGPLAVGDNPLSKIEGELLEVRAEIAPGEAAEIDLVVRGVAVKYDVKKQEISVAGHKAPAPLRDGKLRLTAIVDRTSITVWAADGLTYVPMPALPKAEDRSLALHAKGGAAKVVSLAVHEVGSVWKR